MNRSATDANQREEFFKKSFRGTFSYNVKVSSVNSFLRSMAQYNTISSDETDQTSSESVPQSGNPSKDASIN